MSERIVVHLITMSSCQARREVKALAFSIPFAGENRSSRLHANETIKCDFRMTSDAQETPFAKTQ